MPAVAAVRLWDTGGSTFAEQHIMTNLTVGAEVKQWLSDVPDAQFATMQSDALKFLSNGETHAPRRPVEALLRCVMKLQAPGDAVVRSVPLFASATELGDWLDKRATQTVKLGTAMALATLLKSAKRYMAMPWLETPSAMMYRDMDDRLHGAGLLPGWTPVAKLEASP